MEHDIYKPPQAELTSVLPDVPDFYVVSERKFLILAITTAGMYYLYWFYKHWKNQQIKHHENTWPVARAIFNIFFTHSLFQRMQSKLTEDNKSFPWSPGMLATVYVLAAIIGYISDRISMQSAAPFIFSLLGFFTLIPMVWSTYKAQQAANLASDDAAGAQNSSITPANVFWIIFGLIIWALAFFSLYIELIGQPDSMF